MRLRYPVLAAVIGSILASTPSTAQVFRSTNETAISHDGACTFNECGENWRPEPDETWDVSSRVDCDRYTHGLIRFDISGLPQNHTVVSAKLRVYAMLQSEYATNDFYVNRLTQDWISSEMDWCEASDGQPWNCEGGGCYSPVGQKTFTVMSQHGENPTNSGPPLAVDQWYTIDITDFVQAWVNGEPNYGLLIRQKPSAGHGRNQSMMFAGKENSRSPLLGPELEVMIDIPLAKVTWSRIKASDRYGKTAGREVQEP